MFVLRPECPLGGEALIIGACIVGGDKVAVAGLEPGAVLAPWMMEPRCTAYPGKLLRLVGAADSERVEIARTGDA